MEKLHYQGHSSDEDDDDQINHRRERRNNDSRTGYAAAQDAVGDSTDDSADDIAQATGRAAASFGAATDVSDQAQLQDRLDQLWTDFKGMRGQHEGGASTITDFKFAAAYSATNAAHYSAVAHGLDDPGERTGLDFAGMVPTFQGKHEDAALEHQSVLYMRYIPDDVHAQWHGWHGPENGAAALPAIAARIGAAEGHMEDYGARALDRAQTDGTGEPLSWTNTSEQNMDYLIKVTGDLSDLSAIKRVANGFTGQAYAQERTGHRADHERNDEAGMLQHTTRYAHHQLLEENTDLGVLTFQLGQAERGSPEHDQLLEQTMHTLTHMHYITELHGYTRERTHDLIQAELDQAGYDSNLRGNISDFMNRFQDADAGYAAASGQADASGQNAATDHNAAGFQDSQSTGDLAAAAFAQSGAAGDPDERAQLTGALQALWTGVNAPGAGARAWEAVAYGIGNQALLDPNGWGPDHFTDAVLGYDPASLDPPQELLAATYRLNAELLLSGNSEPFQNPGPKGEDGHITLERATDALAASEGHMADYNRATLAAGPESDATALSWTNSLQDNLAALTAISQNYTDSQAIFEYASIKHWINMARAEAFDQEFPGVADREDDHALRYHTMINAAQQSVSDHLNSYALTHQLQDETLETQDRAALWNTLLGNTVHMDYLRGLHEHQLAQLSSSLREEQLQLDEQHRRENSLPGRIARLFGRGARSDDGN